MSNYEIRKQWRVKLNNQRNKDHDHSSERYEKDAAILNRAMAMYKIDGKVAMW